jgi:hypothetical protein
MSSIQKKKSEGFSIKLFFILSAKSRRISLLFYTERAAFTAALTWFLSLIRAMDNEGKKKRV